MQKKYDMNIEMLSRIHTTNLNLIKLFIIVSIIVIGVWYISKAKEDTESLATEHFDLLPAISSAMDAGYQRLNIKRFDTLDNQIRLDNLNQRVNKLLDNIQQSYKLSHKAVSNPMTFY
jgi:hypothetical protein